MQLTVKKIIFHIKLRDSPLTNKGLHIKSMNGGLVSNISKSLLIVTNVLLLKTTTNKTCFKALNRTIRAVVILQTHFHMIRTTEGG
jgi:hypothetical protein